MLEMEFHGPFRTGAIELEVVFTPEKAWKLKRRGEPGYRSARPGVARGAESSDATARPNGSRSDSRPTARVLGVYCLPPTGTAM